MFSTPEELALRVIDEYKEQNFSDLKQKKTVEEDMEYYYSRWALDELGVCVLCSTIDDRPPSEKIKRFLRQLERCLEKPDLDDTTKVIFTTAKKVTGEILEILECYQYEYFIVM